MASRIPPTLAGGAIARGALFTIYGVRLGVAGHTTVSIANTPVTIVSVDPRRIDAWMPQSAPLGKGALVVTVDGLASRPFPLDVVASNPGLFSRNGEGWGPGRIQNLGAAGERGENSTANAARPRQLITLLATGLGEQSGAQVMIGNRLAKAGKPRPTAHRGEQEITVPIPADAPAGCFVPVYLLAAPSRASNVVTLSIRAGSGPCDPGPVPMFSSANIGLAAISRTQMKSRVSNAVDSVADDARISFNAAGSEPVLSPLRLLPPPGTCTAYTSSFQADTELSTSISSILGPEGRGLNAGAALTLSRGESSRRIAEGFGNAGSYRLHLGSTGIHDRRARPLFLEPGEYVLEGRGGKDVGPLRVAFSVPPPFEWTDREQTSVVDRGRGVTLHWRGVPRGQTVLLIARNVDQITTAIGMCLCVPPASAGQFEIPPALLANVPVSRDLPGVPYDELVMGIVPYKAVPFSAAGLQGGFVVTVYANGRIVSYR
jgi:uncharacterized protein (TIGR03437 family)